MNSLEILIKNSEDNPGSTSYSTTFENTVRISWQINMKRDNDTFYQVNLSNTAPDDVYYFINELLISKTINTNLSNIDSIKITENDLTYTINGENIYEINTMASSSGAQILIALKDLDTNTTLPFVKPKEIVEE